MAYPVLVTVEELFAHLKDPNWLIIDCRFDLMDPAWGFEEYQALHIPGAIYVHLDNDLSSKPTPTTGRHPLHKEADILAHFSAWGIHAGRQVVVYDSTSGAFAARLWWLLRLYGHSLVAVLDGGFPIWVKRGFPTESGVVTPCPARFIPHVQPNQYVTRDFVDQIRQDPHYTLIDSRSAERHHGQMETIDPTAGRIPGSVNRFHGVNLKADGTFLPPEVLRDQFTHLLGATRPQNAVVYCGSGVTSCLNLVAMEYAGLHGARLYPGSWSEWIRDPKNPIARK